jgi:hypothetical protein
MWIMAHREKQLVSGKKRLARRRKAFRQSYLILGAEIEFEFVSGGSRSWNVGIFISSKK